MSSEHTQLSEISQWSVQKISALGSFERGKSKCRPRHAPHLYGGIYPFIQTGDITNSTGRITTFRQTYNEAGLAQSKLWPAGTLCITIAANIAETALLTFPACFPDSVVGFIPDSSKADVTFIAYLFQTMRANVKSKAYGTAQENINLEVLRSLEFPVPNLSTQKSIANILKTLDDRIELLRETNSTLEAIAQALFKSWFVDFDPVHAKQQGREPEGMDASTAALFPDSFEESELGLVPMGWRVGTLADVTTVKGGFAYKSEAFGLLGSPVVKIKNIVGDGTVDLLDAQFIAADMAEKTKRFALADGDIVIAMTGATIGKTGVVVTEENQIPYLNQRVAKFEPNSNGNQNSWFVFVAFQNSSIFDQVVNTASGSAQPNISTSGIESVRLVLPSNHELLKVFDNIAAQLFKGWIANQKQTKTLAILRDTLLPRLISGQLRLPELA
jgi:type I restriction enzyme S subunit